MSALAKEFIEHTESDLIGEASFEGSFQAGIWRDLNFWKSDAIDRTIAAEFPANDINYTKSVGDVNTDWLTRQNYFRSDEDSVVHFPAWVRSNRVMAVSVNTLEDWDCVITDIDSDTVYADAKPQIESNGSKVLLELPIVEFQKSERAKLKPGLLFRYIICRSKKLNGQLSREVLAYVRRVQSPSWLASAAEEKSYSRALAMLNVDTDEDIIEV